MVWPFSRIKALENQVEEAQEARKYDEVLIRRLEHNSDIMRERNAAQAKEIVDLKLLVDELRGQVHSATTQLAKKEGQLQQALKNDSRDPKGRYVGGAAAPTEPEDRPAAKTKTPKPKKGS